VARPFGGYRPGPRRRGTPADPAPGAAAAAVLEGEDEAVAGEDLFDALVHAEESAEPEAAGAASLAADEPSFPPIDVFDRCGLTRPWCRFQAAIASSW
jgi:hypothetical protein